MKHTNIFELNYNLKVIIFSFILIFNYNTGLCNKIYKVIDENTEYNLRLYIFLNIPTCHGCESNCDYLVKSFEKINNIEIVGFISGTNDQGIASLIERNNWKFKIISDELGLYHKYYNIDTTNSYIMLDNEGKLILKKNLSTDTLMVKFVEGFVKSQKIKLSDTDYKLSQDFNIELDSKLQDVFYHGLYSSKYKNYFFIGYRYGNLISTDTLGKIILMKNDLINHKEMKNCSVLNISWRIPDSLILISLNFIKPMSGWSNKIIEYDIIKKEFKNIYFDLIDTLKSSFTIVGCPINEDYVIVYKYQIENNLDTIEFVKPITVYNRDLKFVGDYGYVSDLYRKYNLRKMFVMFFSYSSEFLYSLQMYSDFINVYDKNYNIIDKIKLERSTNLRKTNKNIPVNPSKYDWGEFLSSTSTYRAFLYNQEKNMFCIYFVNETFPPNINDPSSPEIIKEHFIVIYNISGRLFQEFKLKEKSFAPVSFFKNKLTICCFENNSIILKSIILDKLE
jgi:hypothetical protein